jgi:hypothetical protein
VPVLYAPLWYTKARVWDESRVFRDALGRFAPKPGGRRSPLSLLRSRVRRHGVSIPPGLRTPALRALADALDRGVPAQAAREQARQTVIAEFRTVGDALADALEMVENEASQRTLNWAANTHGRLPKEVQRVLAPLTRALRDGDPDKIRDAVASIAAARRMTLVAGANVGDTVRFDPTSMRSVGSPIPRGATATVVRPGYELVYERQRIVPVQATVQAT